MKRKNYESICYFLYANRLFNRFYFERDYSVQTLSLGTLTSSEMKQLIFEVLTPIGYNLIVTPKEVDFIMSGLTEVIRTSIDRALHQKVTE